MLNSITQHEPRARRQSACVIDVVSNNGTCFLRRFAARPGPGSCYKYVPFSLATRERRQFHDNGSPRKVYDSGKVVEGPTLGFTCIATRSSGSPSGFLKHGNVHPADPWPSLPDVTLVTPRLRSANDKYQLREAPRRRPRSSSRPLSFQPHTRRISSASCCMLLQASSLPPHCPPSLLGPPVRPSSTCNHGLESFHPSQGPVRLGEGELGCSLLAYYWCPEACAA